MPDAGHALEPGFLRALVDKREKHLHPLLRGGRGQLLPAGGVLLLDRLDTYAFLHGIAALPWIRDTG